MQAVIDSARIEFIESTHTYLLDGRRVPSITQALKVATYDQFDHVDPAVLAQRAEEGERVHGLIEWIESGRFSVADCPADLLGIHDNWLEFKQATKLRVIACEEIVASEKYRFAGRLDLLCEMDGDASTLHLIETKHTSSPPRSAGPQTAAQEIGLREMRDVGSVRIRRHTLHTRNRRFRLIPHTSADDRATFLAALRVTHWREQA